MHEKQIAPNLLGKDQRDASIMVVLCNRCYKTPLGIRPYKARPDRPLRTERYPVTFSTYAGEYFHAPLNIDVLRHHLGSKTDWLSIAAENARAYHSTAKYFTFVDLPGCSCQWIRMIANA